MILFNGKLSTEKFTKITLGKTSYFHLPIFQNNHHNYNSQSETIEHDINELVNNNYFFILISCAIKIIFNEL